MKKIFAVMLLIVGIFTTAPVQASEFDLNNDFNSNFVFKTNLRNGRVVGIKTYLSIREYPNVNSREIARIPNGAELIMREEYIQGWIQVLAVDGYNYGRRAGEKIGYVNTKYVQFY